MPYPNYYNPVSYSPAPYQTYMPQMQPPAQPPVMMQQQQTTQPAQQQIQQPPIQQSGFVLVQSEQEARTYPVAPGNSITFKDETAPFCYVKTMGFNQLDRPVFEKYRLVKEDEKDIPATEHSAVKEYLTKSDLDALWGEINALKDKLKTLSEKKSVKTRKIEVEDDDDE